MIVTIIPERTPVALYDPPLVWQDIVGALGGGLSDEQLFKGRKKVGFSVHVSVRREDNINTPPWRNNGRLEVGEILGRMRPDMNLEVHFTDHRLSDQTWLVYASFREKTA